MDAGARGQRRTLQDFITPGVQGISSSITRPTVEVNNFEFRAALISMVQQSQFGGSPMEDPNLQLSIFLEVCDTLKLNGASTDVIRLRFFPFFTQGQNMSLASFINIRLHPYMGMN